MKKESLYKIQPERITTLEPTKKQSNVLYIMEWDLRIHENYCVQYGCNISYENESKFYIRNMFYSRANKCQEQFQFQGLKEMLGECKAYNIDIGRLKSDNLSQFIKSESISHIILEYSPLREYIRMLDVVRQISKEHEISLIQIDSHNIVPCKLLTVYKRTPMSVRKCLYRHFVKFQEPFKKLEKHKFNDTREMSKCNLNDLYVDLNKVDSKTLRKNFVGGYTNGNSRLEKFLKQKLIGYTDFRNDPSVDNLSHLSPWVHSGQLSVQEIINKTYEYCDNNSIPRSNEDLGTFIGEMFVWRETAEHFCRHEKNYDNINGALDWAKDTLKTHESDKRPAIYTLKQLEDSKTEDNLWNAAQTEMVITGKMHGYLRMYWAKQIPKWTEKAEDAIKFANHLNDKYSLDGNDPNGYLGVMWSICGSMDRGFAEREITGKVRPMTRVRNGGDYIKKWKQR